MLLIVTSTTHANQVTLAWNPSSGPAAGYRVYYGQQSGRYTFITPTAPSLITTTTYTVPPLPAGTYYFAVKAFDNAGNESGFSNEVSATFSATAENNFSNQPPPTNPTPAQNNFSNPTPTTNPTSAAGDRLVNISTRTWVGVGDNPMIAGFIISGQEPKQVLIRAIGPSMARAGVPNLLYDPTLTLFSGQTILASNNNWRDSQAAAIQATGKAPQDPQESAILVTLNPGSYTAIVRGVSDTTGNALVEVYEVDTPKTRLINVSSRGQTETGDNVMIAGFILDGHRPKRVLIRAIGPTLATVGVPSALTDPTLTLHSGQTVLTSNNDWQDSQATAIQATGLAPKNPLESAILAVLHPGPYTAIVRGVNGATGNTLVEVYDIGD